MGASYSVREVLSRRKRSPDATYVYIYESLYDPKTRRTTIRNVLPLGRIGEVDTRAIRRLVEQLNQYLGAGAEELPGTPKVLDSRLLGPVVFYRDLWEQAGFGSFVRERFAGRHFGYQMAEVVFALVAQRILDPGSKLAAEHWVNEIADFPELEGVSVDLFYTDLLHLDVSVLFHDTTSTYFEIEEPDEAGLLRRYGHSKDERPDRPQALVAVAVNRDGLPMRYGCFPGDTADLATLDTVLEELAALRPRGFYFVGDRAMVSLSPRPLNSPHAGS